jgi:hypothetical protein
MVGMIFYIFLYAGLVFTDLVPVYRDKEKKAAVFCTVVFALAFVLQAMQVFGVEFPSPSEPLIKFINGIMGTGS